MEAGSLVTLSSSSRKQNLTTGSINNENMMWNQLKFREDRRKTFKNLEILYCLLKNSLNGKGWFEEPTKHQVGCNSSKIVF